jgi:hypothetical protein
LEDFAVDAAPPTWLAISNRIFFRCKPLSALLAAFEVRHFDDFAVKAAPTPPWLTIFSGFGERVVAARLAIVAPLYIDVTVDAVVAPWR